MYPGDERKKWPDSLMTDPRASHFWDEGKVVGSLFSEWFTSGPGHVEWDAFFVFGPDAEWGERGPRPLVSWGRTIVGARKQLRADVQKLIGEQGKD